MTLWDILLLKFICLRSSFTGIFHIACSEWELYIPKESKDGDLFEWDFLRFWRGILLGSCMTLNERKGSF